MTPVGMPPDTIDLFEYPIIDGHRKHYIRYPVLVTENLIRQHSLPHLLEEGKYMAVDVMLEGGFQMLTAPNMFDNYEKCLRSCNVHNRYHRFSDEQIIAVMNKSMGL